MKLARKHASVHWVALALLLGVAVPVGDTAGAADLKITGIEKKSDLYKAISGGSLLKEQTAKGVHPSPQEIVAAAQADYGRLVAVLYDQGYFGPVVKISLDGVEAAAIPPVNPPRDIKQAVISIEPGPLFRFGTTEIAPVAPGTELPKGFAPGQTAGLSVLKDTVSSGIDGWRDLGHAKAELSEQNLTARHKDSVINADLRLAPGPRLTFGPLIVDGNKTVRTDRIVEIAGLPTGSVYSPKELKLAQARLRRTGAFNAAALTEAEQVGPDGSLPITAQITEAKPRRFGIGAEVSTTEGLRLSAFWMHRNLFGGAERLRIEGDIKGIGGDTGGKDYVLSVRFDRPATFNPDTDLYVLAEIAELNEVNYYSRQIDLETGVKWLADEHRTYTLGGGLTRAKTRDDFGTRRYTLLTLPASAEYDYRDDELDAKSGYYLKADVRPFAALSGADHGVRSTLDLRGYKTFGTVRPVTFALRGQLGSVYGPALDEAPADYLFYSGGGGTVRGQPYQKLGVDIGGGDKVGGRSFVGASAEARLKTTEKIGVVGFVDAGYIGPEEFYDGSGKWHSGAGLGLRYATGIGPIRVDVAVPTSGPKTNDDFQVYIGIGQAF